MTEAGQTAGAMLRAAREKQGLHIAALATMLKVPPRKLEALEADRYEEFQGATFVRALAQAACRTLKIDPAPVLERLPEQDTGTLSQLERSLNMPFREHGARREGSELPLASQAVMGLVLLLVVGALAFWLWPAGWHLPSLAVSQQAAQESTSGTITTPVPIPAPAPMVEPASAAADPAASAAASPAAAPQTFPQPALPAVASAPVTTTAPAPASAAAVAAPVASLPAGQAPLQVRTRQASWVEVVDARSQVLVSRTLAAGEAAEFDGALPLRVKIGNVSGTELHFRGKPVDLNAVARDNVARLELK